MNSATIYTAYRHLGLGDMSIRPFVPVTREMAAKTLSVSIAKIDGWILEKVLSKPVAIGERLVGAATAGATRNLLIVLAGNLVCCEYNRFTI